MRSRRLFVPAAISLSLLAAACGSDANDAAPAATDAAAAPTTVAAPAATDAEMADIVDTAVGAGDFTTLVAAVEAAGLVETLKGAGPFTVFAPTDAAFAALPAGLLDKLLLPENKEALTKILTYHVVGAKVLAADVAPGKVATVEGSELEITVDGSTVMVDSAKVVATDVLASNGVIHVIDAVLVPADVDVAALMGDGAMEEEATATADIVDTAVGAGDFTTLVAAVEAAGLVETLKGAGPFTVFAPTDAAFAALPAGLLDKLLLPENKEALTKILTYHVVGAKVLAADVAPGKVATVEGSELEITVDGSTVMVDSAKVVATDVLASNGVIHVIDAVLVPADVDVAAL